MKGKYFEPLTGTELQEIAAASLDVLQTTGIIVENQEALELLTRNGAAVDPKTRRAKIPSSLVQEALAKAPSSFTWHARDASNDLRMETGRTYYGPIHTVINVFDLETRDRRPATLRDAQNLSRLMDALERIHLGYCIVHPTDVPEKAAHAHAMMAMAENTEKCFFGRVYGTQVARDCIEMAGILAGGEEELREKPNLLGIINSVSPLQFDNMQTAGLVEYSKAGLPVAICPEIASGSTGPATLAGLLVQHNAEVLAGITIAQLVNPRNPVVYGSVSNIMDVKTGSMRLGSIEVGLISMAVAQLARNYNLPSRVSAGATDAKTLDMQAGYEGAMNLLLATLAGATLTTYSVGGLDLTLSVSYEKIMVDHEILGSVMRAARGIEVNDETLAVDLIKSVGPGGHYLSQKHTRNHMRTEYFLPQLADTRNYEEWVIGGRKDIRERAREEVKHILETHHPRPLEGDVKAALEGVVRKAERRE